MTTHAHENTHRWTGQVCGDCGYTFGPRFRVCTNPVCVASDCGWSAERVSAHKAIVFAGVVADRKRRKHFAASFASRVCVIRI